MLAERYMVTGKRLDNGEIVKGYYMPQYHSAKHGCRVNAIFFSDDYGTYCIPIDPSTVEPVAAKVIWDINKPKCPNCETSLFYYCQNGVAKEFDYCPDCGQRLLWEDE